ncbi:GNAT family N-acetyltransferase [Pseudoalteromonas sp. OANN1]|uniref:GNAT family N-acetyltransferase n=1 Tax=Pseudoalteromonas sp. OANN1 TaxID=2954497 RepID=UPI002096DF30|nr:GNAT family N-acetyltransferase [Pseudoalteromonas sp. OANN1]MCO7199005.1 GNAT family N-acetyltransferase [Pseudoalteromonas sp. OANN1]
MFVDLSTAQAWFDTLDQDKQYPTASPEYIQLEAMQSRARTAVFYLCIGQAEFYYLAGYLTQSEQGLIDFETPRGYGGAITNVTDPKKLAHLNQACISAFAKRGALCGFIRTIPAWQNHRQMSGDSWFDRRTVAIDLTVPDLLASYQTRSRTAIRKSRKEHVCVKQATSLQEWLAFFELYQRRMSELNATQEYLYDRDYFTALSGSALAKLYLAYRDDQVLAGCIVLQAGSFAEYHLSASTKDGMKYACTQACVHFAAQACRAQGVKVMHLGGGLSNDEKDPLFFFKAGFSALHLDFNICRWIFNSAAYEALRAQYQAAGKPVNRVIFYR